MRAFFWVLRECAERVPHIHLLADDRDCEKGIALVGKDDTDVHRYVEESRRR